MQSKGSVDGIASQNNSHPNKLKTKINFSLMKIFQYRTIFLVIIINHNKSHFKKMILSTSL